MVGYIAIKGNEYFEIKGVRLITTDKTYGVELTDKEENVIHTLSITKKNFFYLKTITNFFRAIEYVIGKCKFEGIKIETYNKDTIWFYNYNLELSRRHILQEIKRDISSTDYWQVVNMWLDKFANDNGVEITLLGRGKRHCCIEDNARNRYLYAMLYEEFNKMQDTFVEILNGE